MSKMPLLVHVVFHPDSTEARKVASHIHNALNHDAIVPGLDIPTTFVKFSELGPPGEQGLDRAEKSYVVVLADDHVVAGKNAIAWQEFVAQQWKSTQDNMHRFVPIQMSTNAWGFNQDLTDANVSFGRAFHKTSGDQRSEQICRIVTIELLRFLLDEGVGQGDKVAAPVKFFISHAKQDLALEPKVVEELLNTLKADHPIESWVDSGSINPGANFAKAIENGIKESSFLAVLTDNYASREWCRTEVLLAKEHQRPIVVVDALQRYEVRSFPYLGNVPVSRWETGSPYRAIDLLIKESVRQLHTKLRLEQWNRLGRKILVRPPELATISSNSGEKLLYPDPPLGSEESRLLDQLGIDALTPLEQLARQASLEGKAVAISMSESSDVEKYGFHEVHLDNMALELSRYLLIQRASLAYGGHIGRAAFTEKLFDMVRSHNQSDRTEKVKPIANYSGWPLPEPSIEAKAGIYGVGHFRRVERPDSLSESDNEDFLSNPGFFPATKSVMHRFAWSLGMTKMRQVQTRETCARIVLGGKTDKTLSTQPDGSRAEKWYMSRIPGVLEEVFISAKAGQPIFLIGAYGGAAALIVDILEGKHREEATWEFQKAAPYSEELRELYLARGSEWENYDYIVRFLREKGIARINPLLSEEENRELFHTVDLMRTVELVLKGLDRLD